MRGRRRASRAPHVASTFRCRCCRLPLLRCRATVGDGIRPASDGSTAASPHLGPSTSITHLCAHIHAPCHSLQALCPPATSQPLVACAQRSALSRMLTCSCSRAHAHVLMLTCSCSRAHAQCTPSALNEICRRRNHSMSDNGRKMMFIGKGSWKPEKNWKLNPKKAIV